MKDDLVECLCKSARLAGQPIPRAQLQNLQKLHQLQQHQSQQRHPSCAEQRDAGQTPAALFAALWRSAGLDGQCALLPKPTPADLPFAIHGADIGWGLVQARGTDGVWFGSANGGPLALHKLGDVACISLPHRLPGAADNSVHGSKKTGAPSALGLVRAALWRRKGVFIDAVLATGLVTLLTLATSLFSMQVYDRVIPNQGFNTLTVLTVGVALSIGIEFILKQVRSRSVDRACNAIDHELSEWFFQRMLGIRMEARPTSVGTLASQVKGFEMVRGVLASTSIFMLTDVPFALFFLIVIGIVGGPLVFVPLLALPIALTAGLMFQHAIARNARLNLAASNQKTGLLVETVDGTESLKANSAEWTLQSRWRQLVLESGESDQRVRDHSALSQNLTASVQQLAYIGLVAFGAYMVSDNKLTMGALLACSIISNRALMPVVQLPGVMVQWAQARAAIAGLERIIALPNEADDADHMLAPQCLTGGLRFERVRYAYGREQAMALELDTLEIKPGERVGLIGSIGSGKSTLLKLASGLYRPGEGKVFLGGIDVALLAPPVVREMVGYLPQDARLFSGSLRDNLLLGLPDPGEAAILAAAHRTGLIELILGQPRGLALAITEGGRGVSGGQKQLIAMTRMVLARPAVWLLDEPTGAMDSVTEARIVALLRELAAEGATLVATTHKSALLPLLERLIVLQGGRVLLDGPRDAVLAKLSGKVQPMRQQVPA